jgi:hypothetical protein
MSGWEQIDFGFGPERCRHIGEQDGCPVYEFPSGGTIVDRPIHRSARNTDPRTSQDAALAQGRKIGSKHYAVMKALVEAGPLGLIDHDHLAINGLEQDTAGKRRGELMEYGFVADSKRTRTTPRGSKAIVWIVTDAGERFWQSVKGKAS